LVNRDATALVFVIFAVKITGKSKRSINSLSRFLPHEMESVIDSPGNGVRRSASGVLRCHDENILLGKSLSSANQYSVEETNESESSVHDEDPFNG